MNTLELDHPFLGDLTGDQEVARLLSAENDLSTMLKIESALALVEGKLSVIPGPAAAAIVSMIEDFVPDMERLRSSTMKDGVPVPGLVQQLREKAGDKFGKYVHFGATSQDIMDTSLVLRVMEILSLFDLRLMKVVSGLNKLMESKKEQPLMGKTRMQSALPMTLFDRVRNWIEPLAGLQSELHRVQGEVSRLQFAGAVGTLDKLGDKGPQVRKALAKHLALDDPQGPWHVQRFSLARLSSLLSQITAAFSKMGSDVTLMGQNEVKRISFLKGGSSSAMPHKCNPVDAEVLGSFAQYNAALLGGMHNALVHEQERSGKAWTLEWLVLPQMLITTGASFRAVLRMLKAVSF